MCVTQHCKSIRVSLMVEANVCAQLIKEINMAGMGQRYQAGAKYEWILVTALRFKQKMRLRMQVSYSSKIGYKL